MIWLHGSSSHLGLGSVIKGWDEGVMTMKQGEVARINCTPDYVLNIYVYYYVQSADIYMFQRMEVEVSLHYAK